MVLSRPTRLSTSGLVYAEGPVRPLLRQIAVGAAGGGAGGPLSPGGRMNGAESPGRAQAKRTFEAPGNEVIRYTTGGRRRGAWEPEQRAPTKTARRGFVEPPASPTKNILKYAGFGKQENFSVACYADGNDLGTKVSRGTAGVGIIVDPKMTVIEVERGSAAHNAGLKKGMKLTAVDGLEVKSQTEAVAALRRAGDSVYIKCEDKVKGKVTQPNRGSIGGNLSRFFNDEPTPSRPVVSAGLPGVGPTDHYQETPRSEPASVRLGKKNYQVPDKPNLMSPCLSAVSPRLGAQHKNSTSYQLAAAAGALSEDGSWAGNISNRRRAQVDVPKGAGNIVEHYAPTDPAERTALWRAHSPARGRAKQGGLDTAWGVVPGMKGNMPVYKAKKSIEVEHSLHLGSASPKMGTRPDERRSRTPDRPLSSWTTHGDITGGFRHVPGDAKVERSTTGVRLRTYHNEGPDLAVDRQRRRSFTPNSRHSRPMPEPTDVLSHGHSNTESPRSGRRYSAESPHRTHNSTGVWGCLRTE